MVRRGLPARQSGPSRVERRWVAVRTGPVAPLEPRQTVGPSSNTSPRLVAAGLAPDAVPLALRMPLRLVAETPHAGRGRQGGREGSPEARGPRSAAGRLRAAGPATGEGRGAAGAEEGAEGRDSCRRRPCSWPDARLGRGLPPAPGRHAHAPGARGSVAAHRGRARAPRPATDGPPPDPGACDPRGAGASRKSSLLRPPHPREPQGRQ